MHLALTLDCKLLFSKQLKIANARKVIGIIPHLSSHLPQNTLDYCDIIYHILTVANQFDSSIKRNYSMTSIESTHYQAALAVSGAWKGSNPSKSGRRSALVKRVEHISAIVLVNI